MISLKQIASVLQVEEDVPSVLIEYFSIDSRQVVPQSLFFALEGERVDGHLFLEEVALKGAVAAVVSKSYHQDVSGLLLIRVENVLNALQKLARWKISSSGMRCIGITGSVGKTTTKEFLATLLEGKFKVQKTIGNANSQRGLPISILNQECDADFFVAEMGMSQSGEISKLVEIVSPEVVLVTKVALSHACFFSGGIEQIAEAKAEILTHPQTKIAFINSQAKQFKAFQSQHLPKNVFYGLQSDSFINSCDIVMSKKGDLFSIGDKTFSLPFTATHLAENFLGAALVANYLGMDWEEIFSQIKFLEPYERRFEKIERKGIVYINDSYNANPESVGAALENLPRPAEGKKTVAVLGEMRELGQYSRKAHEDIGALASKHADVLFSLAGDCRHMADAFAASGKPAYFFHAIEDLKAAFYGQVQPGDVVLLKASKSLKIWEVLDSVD